MGGFPLSLGEELSLKYFLPGVKEKPGSCHCHSLGGRGKALQGGTEEKISCLETET